jgi:CubicO group peptidase (beta-lactamase class C family)
MTTRAPRRLAVAFATVLALARSSGANPLPAASGIQPGFVDAIVEGELARGDVAGAVVVVIAEGAPALVKGYGSSDVARRAPVTPQTLFRLASISKLFTALAVLQLVDEGKLDLDADVNRYLDFEVPPAHGEPATLRQLLTHRAGFEERLRDLTHANAPAIPLADFLRSHLPMRSRVPGRSPSYSNYGFALAGYVVQRVSGLPFERYAAERIFAPLGMTSATFEQPLPAALAPRASQGYRVASAEPGPFEIVNDAPAGALSASGEDMARFLRMLLGGGELDGVRVLSPQGFARWVEPQVSIAGNGLGLAIYEAHLHGVRSIGHGGDLSYFHSDLHAMPEHGFGVFVSQNSTGKSPRSLRGVLVPALIKRHLAREGRGEAMAFAPTPPGELVGSYMTTRRSDRSWMRLQGLLDQIVVSAGDDGTLLARGISDAAGNPERFREVAPGRFRTRDGEREIAFARDAAGQVVELQPWFPGITYERARLVDTQNFALAVFVPAALVALCALVAPLAGFVARRALGAPPAPPRTFLARALTLATAGAWLAALATFTAFTLDGAQHVWRFSRREDLPLRVAIGGTWLAAGLSIASAAACAAELRSRALTLRRRAARALAPLAFLALAWFAWNWGLLTNGARY